MKSLILALTVVMTAAPAWCADTAPQTRKVCVDVKDRQGKTRQQCKDVRVHQKLEGHKVPEKK